MNNEKQFEDLLRTVKFDDEPNHRHRDKLGQELLAAFAGQQRQQRRTSLDIWRTIMQSKITKLAAVAAVIIVVGVMGIRRQQQNPGKPISSVEFLAKAQAAEQTLFAKDQIVHIVSEITVFGNSYNQRANELLEKLKDPKLSSEQVNAINRDLISSWMVSWLPMASLQANGEQRLTEIRLSGESDQPYTIYDHAWYEHSTGRFVRIMETEDSIIFANAFDGGFVYLTTAGQDGTLQLKSQAITGDFRAPENPAEFLGITAGVRQCLSDKCVVEPVQEVTEDTLEDGTSVLVYKLGFTDPWGKMNTYYLMKVRRADEIIAEIEYTYNGQKRLHIRRIASETVDSPDYSWNLAELDSEELGGEKPSDVSVADVAIPNISVRDMIERAGFETYIFSNDPAWTQERMIVDVVDPMNPTSRMFIVLYTAQDSRHVLLIESQGHNKYMSAMFRQAEANGQPIKHTTYANGCKLYEKVGGEDFWTDMSFRHCGFEPAKDRMGLITETPAGTFPLIAINGALSEEELAGLMNSLIPAREYKVK